MSFDTDLIPIEKILADLYGSKVTRIVDWAGLESKQIIIEGAAIDIWHWIITEAVRTDKLSDLIDQCLDDKRSVDLKTAYDYYLELKESSSAKKPDKSNRAYVEYVECKVTFSQDIFLAKHEYYYNLKNFGSAEDEKQFSFFIPNAQPDQVAEEYAFEGADESHKLSVNKEFFNGGTKLILRNLLSKSDHKVLRFSYNAPTTRLIYCDANVRVGFYQAELFHDFDITSSEKVEINFPENTHIKLPLDVSNAKINGATVVFDAYNIPRGERRYFPIFFDLSLK